MLPPGGGNTLSDLNGCRRVANMLQMLLLEIGTHARMPTHIRLLSLTHTHAHARARLPADGQHGHLPMVAAALLGLPGRQLPHQRPLLLAAAAADVLVATGAADGVQVVARVFGGSRWCAGRQRGHGWGRGVRAGGGERRPNVREVKGEGQRESRG